MDLTGASWFKSSKSAGNGQCVEVAFVDGDVAMRDSKDPEGPALMFGAKQWAEFVAGVSRGEFPRP